MIFVMHESLQLPAEGSTQSDTELSRVHLYFETPKLENFPAMYMYLY